MECEPPFKLRLGIPNLKESLSELSAHPPTAITDVIVPPTLSFMHVE